MLTFARLFRLLYGTVYAKSGRTRVIFVADLIAQQVVQSPQYIPSTRSCRFLAGQRTITSDDDALMIDAVLSRVYDLYEKN